MITLVPIVASKPSDTFASRAVKSRSVLMQRDVRPFFKTSRAKVVLYFGASEACSEAIDEASKRGLESLIPIIFIQRMFKLGELLLCFLQLIKQLHLFHLTLQQLLLNISKHAIQVKNSLLNNAFIAQGNYRPGYSQCSLCAFCSTCDPIQHSFTPAILDRGQKASTVAGVI